MSLTEFKDAFTQLNSAYPAAGKAQPGAISSSVLSDQDHSALTGLADFQASMSGNFSNLIAGESGHIDYQVSQTTRSQGADKSNLSVVQTQDATLASSYTKARPGEDPSKGNYDIFRVNDSSSITTSFQYAKDSLGNDRLKAASITSVVNQLDQYEKLVKFQVVERKATPTHRSTVQDISSEWPAAARTEG